MWKLKLFHPIFRMPKNVYLYIYIYRFNFRWGQCNNQRLFQVSDPQQSAHELQIPKKNQSVGPTRENVSITRWNANHCTLTPTCERSISHSQGRGTHPRGFRDNDQRIGRLRNPDYLIFRSMGKYLHQLLLIGWIWIWLIDWASGFRLFFFFLTRHASKAMLCGSRSTIKFF